MARFDASSAECLVFTYKKGLLSAIAHDLKIRVAKFEIEVDEQSRAIAARFDAASLRVMCAMQAGVKSPGTLSRDNKRQIEANIVGDVLDARTYPEIRFESSAVQDQGDAHVIKGTLSLHGKQRQITVRVRQEGDYYVAQARLHQPDFGIHPYSALLGTLKVQADVTVQVSVPIAS